VRFLQKAFRALIQVDDSPRRTALAFSLGVFLGFSPLLGLHTALGLAAAVIFRLNKIAVLIGVYANNPWLVVPFYGFATWFGLQITGMPEGLDLPAIGFFELFSAEFWRWLLGQWRLLIPAIIGSTILCALLSLIAYPASLYVLNRFRVGSEVSETESETSRE